MKKEVKNTIGRENGQNTIASEVENSYYQISFADYLNSVTEFNPVDKFISGGKISINKDDWHSLNEDYSQEQIISFMSEAIINGKIEMPTVDYKYQDAVESFKSLCDYKCKGIQSGDVFTRYEYTYDISNKYIDESNVGNVASNYFQQKNRFYCDSINSPSPYRTWHDKKFLKSALSALWSLGATEVNANTLRTVLSLRKYVASQFKPTVAKSIYEYLNSENILDICSGWGDRLCGFYASKSGKRYVGIDPNTRLHKSYDQQISLYQSIVDGKEALMIRSAAEDVILSPNSFDTVFTSPPYFNVERYSTEESQSWRRYRKLDLWLEGFLFKSIQMAWKSLKSGGYLAINISDVYSNHTINKICDPMNDYIKSIGGTYVECIGMKMAKRPNSGALKGKEGVFIEPIWIWKK